MAQRARKHRWRLVSKNAFLTQFGMMAMAVGLTQGCGADARVAESTPAIDAGVVGTSNTIKVYVATEDGGWQLREFGASASSAQADDVPATSHGAGTLRTKAEKPGVVYISNQLNPVSTSAMEDLLLRAAKECEADSNFQSAAGSIVNQSEEIWSSTADFGTLFYFGDDYGSCEYRLWQQENVLCAASKLMRVADGGGGETWSANPRETSWYFPGQAPEAKYLLRDMAMYALANLALIHDTGPRSGSQALESCVAQYTSMSVAAPGSINSQTCTQIFGGPTEEAPAYAPRRPRCEGSIDAQEASRAAIHRLRLTARVMQTASTMLEKLIRQTVREDVGVAESKRALARDGIEGQRLYWGSLGDPNSLGHVAKTLFGRISTHLDPYFNSHRSVVGWGTCSIRPGQAILEQLYARTGKTARAEWRPARTAGERLAVRLLSGGAVLFEGPERLDETTLRAALKEQVVIHAAISRGLSGNDPGFSASPEAKALRDAIAKSPIADLQFALRHNLIIYELLAGEPFANHVGYTPPAGMQFEQVIAPTVLALGGIALNRSLDPEFLSYDVMGRFGALQDAAICHRRETEPFITTATYFQSPFALGTVLAQQLRNMEGRFQQIPGMESESRQSGLAATETASWAGGWMKLHRGAEPPPPGTPGGTPPPGSTLWTLYVSSDVGQSLGGQLPVLVEGGDAGANADCLAGVRKMCALPVAGTAPLYTTSTPMPPNATVTGYVFALPSAIKSYHIVMPASPAAAGKVLGTISTNTLEEPDAYQVFSPLQRALANEVFGIAKAASGCANERVAETDLGVSYQHCAGVVRNQFIPLTNELTGGSTESAGGAEASWKHYLSLAKEAAAHADELGQKLIDLGERRDQKLEAAAEELAELCGELPDISDVSVQTVTVGTQSVDKIVDHQGSKLDKCLYPHLEPVAMFGSPRGGKEWKDVVCRTVTTPYGTVDPPDVCGSVDDAANLPGLKLLGESQDPQELEDGKVGKLSDTCGEVTQLYRDLVSGVGLDTTKLTKAASQTWAEVNSLRQLLASTHLEVKKPTTAAGLEGFQPDYRQWRLQSSGKTIAETGNPNTWPTCASGCDAELRDMLNAFLTSTPANGAALLWKLQGQLWVLGAAAGQLPAGLFRTFIPVANFDPLSGNRLPIPTIFGNGHFIDSGNGKFRLDGANTVELSELVGTARRFDPNGFWPGANIPVWLENLRAQTSSDRVLAAFAQNNQISAETTVGLPSWVLAYEKFAGTHCPSDADDPSPNGVEKQTDYSKSRLWIPGPALDRWLLKQDASAGGNGKPPVAATTIKIHLPIVANGRVDRQLLQYVHPGWESILGDPRLGDYFGRQQVPPVYEANWGEVQNAQFPFSTGLLTPGMIAPIFINSYPGATSCTNIRETVGALGLACLLDHERRATASPWQSEDPPTITTPDDLTAYTYWMDRQVRNIYKSVDAMWVEGLPLEVINSFSTSDAISSGAISSNGKRGALLYRIRGQLSQLARLADGVRGDLVELALAFRSAKNTIALYQNESKSTMLKLALERSAAVSNLARGLLQGASYSVADIFGTKGAINAGLMALAVTDYAVTTAGIDQSEGLEKEKLDLQLQNALLHLELESSQKSTSIREGLHSLRSQAAEIRAELVELETMQQRGRMILARAAGVSFVPGTLGEPGKASFKTNDIIDTQFNLTSDRYDRALQDARRSAYTARLALEQRLGVRLANMYKGFGGLSAPNSWADEMCTSSGIDYESLRAKKTTTNGHDNGAFASPFIGDYIRKLERLAEQYNIEYPFHEGEDLTVLSLRSDLMGKDTTCLRTAPNLLYHSDDLTRSHVEGTSDGARTYGWSRAVCQSVDRNCLEIRQLAAVAAPPDGGPAGTQLGADVQWLRWTAPSATDAGVSIPALPDAAVADAGPDAPRDVMDGDTRDAVGSLGDSPSASDSANVALGADRPGAVWQRVYLSPGGYILSWYDQARTAAGLEGSTTGYEVKVVDVDEGQAALVEAVTATRDWSRHEHRFAIDRAAWYDVVVQSSILRDGTGILFTKPQLEWTADPARGASAYVPTTSSRDYVATDCPKSIESFQAGFSRVCTVGERCYRELVVPFELDTIELDDVHAPLSAKLAGSNYNYRHVSLAANLVGTGVIDCSRVAGGSTTDCYASTTTKYSLFHDAYQVPILNAGNETECFNFGSGSINEAKALASERYLGVPLSSADRSLLEHVEFTKPEFAGRPLDGRYRLRIWEHPALRWDRLEDVQLMVRYRYWAAIDPGSRQ